MTIKRFLGMRIAGPFTIRDNRNETVFDTESKRRYVLRGSGQRWEIQMRLVDPTGSERLGPKISAHRSAHGQSESFEIPVIQYPGNDDIPRQSINFRPATVRLPAAGSQFFTGRSGTGTSVTLPEGYFFKFPDHSKIYQCTTSVVISPTVNTIVRFYPSAVQTVTTARGQFVDTIPDIKVLWGDQGFDETTYSRGREIEALVQLLEAV